MLLAMDLLQLQKYGQKNHVSVSLSLLHVIIIIIIIIIIIGSCVNVIWGKWV